MDVIIIITIIAFVALIVSCYSVRISKETMWHQALLDVQRDYRSPEMGYALRRLWDLYEECLDELGLVGKEDLNEKDGDIKNKLKEKYKSKFEADEKRMSNEKDVEKKFEYFKRTLDAQRRLVSHFFEHLYDLVNNHILPRRIVYEYWGDFAINTVRDINIPLEETLVDIIAEKRPKVKEEKEAVTRKLCKLRDDFDDFKAFEEFKKKGILNCIRSIFRYCIKQSLKN